MRNQPKRRWDLGHLFFWMARLYVWSLTAIAMVTVAYIFVPVQSINSDIAGIWYAVAGFGSLILLIAMFFYLLNRG